MALYINTNYNSLYAQEYLTQNMAAMAITQNQLSSGQRITDASVDPAGYAIGQTMQEDVLGFTQGMNNANQAISMVQVATGGMNQTISILQQMSTIAAEGASGTYSSTQLSDLQTQFNQLQTEVNNIANTTTYNSISLLQNSAGSIAIQVGNGTTSYDLVSVPLSKTDTTTLGIAASNVSTVSGSTDAMTAIQGAINTVTSDISQIGGAQSVLQDASLQNLDMANNLSNAKSTILDTDYALASSNLAQESILNAASIAMLAQANTMPDYAMQLLLPPSSSSTTS